MTLVKDGAAATMTFWPEESSADRAEGDRIELCMIDARPPNAGTSWSWMPFFAGTSGEEVVARFIARQCVTADVVGGGVADLANTVISTANLRRSRFLR